MLLAVVITHAMQVGPGTLVPTVGSGGGCITAVSLVPDVGEGEAQIFEARYGHCEGAAAFRVVQLWVGDEVTAEANRINLGFEAGAFFLEEGGSCAPQAPMVLTSSFGTLDCAASTVVQSGNELIVQWALGFDVATFAGEHGVFFDAKGGTGDPEPRLDWTRMGTFTVSGAPMPTTGSDPADGSGDELGDGSASSDPGSSTANSGGTAVESTSNAEGGLPGAGPRRPSTGGCACSTTQDSDWAMLLVIVAIIRRARKPASAPARSSSA